MLSKEFDICLKISAEDVRNSFTSCPLIHEPEEKGLSVNLM